MTFRNHAAMLSVILALVLAAGCGNAEAVSESSKTTSGVSEETVSAASAAGVTSAAQSAASGSTAQSTAASEGTASAADSSVKLTLKIDSSDGRMEILVPGNWTDVTGKLDTTGEAQQQYTIEAGCYEEESFLTANGESKVNSPLSSLQEYADAILDGVSANKLFSNVKKGDMQDMTLSAGGFAAKKVKFTASYQGQDIVYFIYAAEGTDNYYQFCCWSGGSNAASAEKNFDAIVNSFTELKT